MFYSRQLLARKTPLGQIWMAATTHAKINNNKLHNQLNINEVCKQILNPSVPMALRLSGILKGGVVYERKVKLLSDDATRLLVEINRARKYTVVQDQTLLPKGKSQAKYEAVTLPDHEETEEVEEIERSSQFAESATMMGFQQTSYVSMQLDNVEAPYTSHNLREDDEVQYHHQVDYANITLVEGFDNYQAENDLHNRFERFDIEEDDYTQTNFAQHEHTQIPTSIITYPPCQEQPEKQDEIQEQYQDNHVDEPCEGPKEASQLNEVNQKQGPPRKRARRTAYSAMDYEQTIVPAHIYQSWFQNAPDTKRERKRKRSNLVPFMKITNLMELPPVVLACGLFEKGYNEIYYPAPLLELWKRSTQSPHHSPSGTTYVPPPRATSSSSHSERLFHQDPIVFFSGSWGCNMRHSLLSTWQQVPLLRTQTNLCLNKDYASAMNFAGKVRKFSVSGVNTLPTWRQSRTQTDLRENFQSHGNIVEKFSGSWGYNMRHSLLSTWQQGPLLRTQTDLCLNKSYVSAMDFAGKVIARNGMLGYSWTEILRFHYVYWDLCLMAIYEHNQGKFELKDLVIHGLWEARLDIVNGMVRVVHPHDEPRTLPDWPSRCSLVKKMLKNLDEGTVNEMKSLWRPENHTLDPYKLWAKQKLHHGYGLPNYWQTALSLAKDFIGADAKWNIMKIMEEELYIEGSYEVDMLQETILNRTCKSVRLTLKEITNKKKAAVGMTKGSNRFRGKKKFAAVGMTRGSNRFRGKKKSAASTKVLLNEFMFLHDHNFRGVHFPSQEQPSQPSQPQLFLLERH